MAEDPASVRRLADLIRERSDTVHWEDVKHDESNQTSESKVCRILRDIVQRPTLKPLTFLRSANRLLL